MALTALWTILAIYGILRASGELLQARRDLQVVQRAGNTNGVLTEAYLQQQIAAGMALVQVLHFGVGAYVLILMWPPVFNVSTLLSNLSLATAGLLAGEVVLIVMLEMLTIARNRRMGRGGVT